MDIERLQNKISALKNELKCLVKELKRMKQGRRQAD